MCAHKASVADDPSALEAGDEVSCPWEFVNPRKDGLRAVKTETIEKMVGYRPDRGGGARFNGTRVGGRAGQGPLGFGAHLHGDSGWPLKNPTLKAQCARKVDA
jgi:hypothetical protein